jgi:hypothetical protein
MKKMKKIIIVFWMSIIGLMIKVSSYMGTSIEGKEYLDLKKDARMKFITRIGKMITKLRICVIALIVIILGLLTIGSKKISRKKKIIFLIMITIVGIAVFLFINSFFESNLKAERINNMIENYVSSTTEYSSKIGISNVVNMTENVVIPGIILLIGLIVILFLYIKKTNPKKILIALISIVFIEVIYYIMAYLFIDEYKITCRIIDFIEEYYYYKYQMPVITISLLK